MIYVGRIRWPSHSLDIVLGNTMQWCDGTWCEQNHPPMHHDSDSLHNQKYSEYIWEAEMNMNVFQFCTFTVISRVLSNWVVLWSWVSARKEACDFNRLRIACMCWNIYTVLPFFRLLATPELFATSLCLRPLIQQLLFFFCWNIKCVFHTILFTRKLQKQRSWQMYSVLKIF